MLQGDRIEQANQSQHAGACQRGDGHADERHEELVEMVGEQAATQPVAEAGANERADHVVRAAAEQEHEGCAGAGGRESREGRRIQRFATFDHVESLVRLPYGDALRFARGFPDMVEMLGIFLRRFAVAVLTRLFRDRIAIATSGRGRRLDIAHVQRTCGGIAFLRAFRDHFQRVEHGIVGTFLVLLGLLPFLELLGQFGRHLRGVALVEMLHQPFGNVGLAVVHRAFAEVDVEPVGEVLEQPDAFGVDAGGRQVDDFGDAVLAVRAGGLDVGEVHVGAHVHAQWIGDAVHHFTYAEAACSGAEVKHADADDHAGFRRDAGFGYRLVPIAFDVFHIERDGVCVEFADCLRAVVNTFSILVMFM